MDCSRSRNGYVRMRTDTASLAFPLSKNTRHTCTHTQRSLNIYKPGRKAQLMGSSYVAHRTGGRVRTLDRPGRDMSTTMGVPRAVAPPG